MIFLRTPWILPKNFHAVASLLGPLQPRARHDEPTSISNFAELARERTSRHPIRTYVWIPIERAGCDVVYSTDYPACPTPAGSGRSPKVIAAIPRTSKSRWDWGCSMFCMLPWASQPRGSVAHECWSVADRDVHPSFARHNHAAARPTATYRTLRHPNPSVTSKSVGLLRITFGERPEPAGVGQQGIRGVNHIAAARLDRDPHVSPNRMAARAFPRQLGEFEIELARHGVRAVVAVQQGSHA